MQTFEPFLRHAPPPTVTAAADAKPTPDTVIVEEAVVEQSDGMM